MLSPVQSPLIERCRGQHRAPRLFHAPGRRLRGDLCGAQRRPRFGRRQGAGRRKPRPRRPMVRCGAGPAGHASTRSTPPTSSPSTAPIAGERPQADALVTATPGLVLGVLTADCGPVLFADPQARRDRCGPCRLERRARRRSGEHDRRDGGARRLAQTHRRLPRPLDQPPPLRGRAGIRRALPRNKPGLCGFLFAVRAAGPCHVRPAGPDAEKACRGRHRGRESRHLHLSGRSGLFLLSANGASQGSRTTGGRSRRSCSATENRTRSKAWHCISTARNMPTGCSV